MIVITTPDEFNEILKDELFVMVPVLEFPKIHRKGNTLSFIYGIGSTSKKEFLYNNVHYDYPASECDIGLLRIKNDQIILNKGILPIYESVMEGNLILWHEKGDRLPNFFESTHCASDVPIFRWIETLRPYLHRIIKCIDVIEYPFFRKYDNFLNQLIQIENAGLYVDISDNNSCEGNARIEYTEYFPYTTTGRPSNRFAGINYAALNKNDGSRNKYISRFKSGTLVEFDYEAYHIHLISKLIGFSFDENPYLSLSRKIFNIETPGQQELDAIKNLVFSQVYGGVRSEFIHIDFFQKLNTFIDRLRIPYNNGTLNTFLFKRPFRKSDNLIKTFNYLLQNLESELNSIILTKINRFLRERESKCILYTYDSFLFDINPDENYVIHELRSIIESINVPCRIKSGKNYGEMTLL